MAFFSKENLEERFQEFVKNTERKIKDIAEAIKEKEIGANIEASLKKNIFVTIISAFVVGLLTGIIVSIFSKNKK